VAGAVIRHFYNERHAGRGNHWWAWPVAAVALLVAIYISMPQTTAGRSFLGLKDPAPPVQVAGLAKAPDAVAEIVTSRCSMCHAQEPVWQGIHIAPKGVKLDTPEMVQRWRTEIIVQAGLTRAMPPNNLTEMTEAERAVLRQWAGNSLGQKSADAQPRR